jgi:hypothetical protein
MRASLRTRDMGARHPWKLSRPRACLRLPSRSFQSRFRSEHRLNWWPCREDRQSKSWRLQMSLLALHRATGVPKPGTGSGKEKWEPMNGTRIPMSDAGPVSEKFLHRGRIAVWMDLLLFLIVLFPLVFWRGNRVGASSPLIPVGRELPSTLEASQLQAASASQPHPTLAP